MSGLPWRPTIAQQRALARSSGPRPVEQDHYRCFRLSLLEYVEPCRGLMVPTLHVATRSPTLTCDLCGRVALAEPKG